MPDEPTYIPTERMPELAADIRLVLEALEAAAYDATRRIGWNVPEGEEVRVAVEYEGRAQDMIAAYERLKAAFGKE